MKRDLFCWKVVGMNEFDVKARSWDDDPVKRERARVIAEAIKASVPLNDTMSALEYGCGTGLLSFALRPSLGSIILADSSEGMLEVLRDKLRSSGISTMRPVALDLAVEPLPDERVDLIYSAMTLHHVPDTDQLLGRFRALLNPAGILCIADLDQEDGSFHGPEFTGHKGFDRQELAAKASRAGFREIRFSTVFALEKEVAGTRRVFPVFLMVARIA